MGLLVLLLLRMMSMGVLLMMMSVLLLRVSRLLKHVVPTGWIGILFFVVSTGVTRVVVLPYLRVIM